MVRTSSARDLSSYLARRTSEHFLNKLGRSARYSDGSFEYDSNKPNELGIVGGYTLIFRDYGKRIMLILDNTDERLESLKSQLRGEKGWVDLNVKGKDKKVIKKIEIYNGEEFGLRIVPVHFNNTSGRTQNRNELFHSVYRSTVVPVLEKIFVLRGG